MKKILSWFKKYIENKRIKHSNKKNALRIYLRDYEASKPIIKPKSPNYKEKI